MPDIFREQLPDGCPPDEADEIIARRVVFRLVRYSPPSQCDFRSQRAENPERQFGNVSECRARGLSVHTSRQSSENLSKLPRMRNRGMIPCRVVLDEGAGYIQQTGKDRFHLTWWPLAHYDILRNCSLDE